MNKMTKSIWETPKRFTMIAAIRNIYGAGNYLPVPGETSNSTSLPGLPAMHSSLDSNFFPTTAEAKST
jgi:hypothetical protein